MLTRTTRFDGPAHVAARCGAVAAALALQAIVGNTHAFAQSSATGSVGLDLAAVPRYAGASSYHVLPLPAVALAGHSASNWHVFASGLEAGAAWSVTPNLSIGPLVGLGLGRKEDDAAILNGTGNIADSFLYGAFVRWQAGPASANVRFLQSAHSGYGNHVTLALAYRIFDGPRDRVTASLSTVWANRSAAQTEFGIDDAQAAASAAHLPTYAPSSGFQRTDLRVTLEHRLDAHWSARAGVGAGTLVGDAANSPIVERRASVFGSMGVAYRF
ncbi:MULTISPECIES: MipA/OmpV family protein [unclassified Burkholderia]|uniref:MipA/OmpV family protein n=1 Tax=unclassified Burkholderia TaxID=2613784 RepID=UPI00075D95AE|nr:MULTISPECIES: MipA/OmpV family protein [unclassified Burkholderia]KVN03457.1 hypothetical protein WT08_23115 [Burkholderia sp. MSMB1552]KWZ55889.1 hypothetical protein WS92_08175 [Burkholderia sp. MSMB1588]